MQSKLMILMTLADGNVEDSEVDAMIGIYEKITQSNLDKSSLMSEIDELGKLKTMSLIIQDHYEDT